MNFHNLMCCGIKEISGLRGFNEDNYYHMMLNFGGAPPAAWICCNGVQSGGYVELFRQFVLKEKLGSIIDLPVIRNPNSSNLLDVFMWQADRDACVTWFQKRRDRQNSLCVCTLCTNTRLAEKRATDYAASLAALAAAVPPVPSTMGQRLRAAASSLAQRGIEQQYTTAPQPPSNDLDRVIQQLDRGVASAGEVPF